VICRQTERRFEIESWIMSCRVLGRRVEEAILQHLVAEARRRGIAEIVGRYVPTARNALVRDHYEKLGFALVSADGGETVWRLPVVDHAAKDLPMTIALRRLEEAV
jgi:predicted enzyme involved in methoxymalonyl-ACP biosynthesis